MREDTRQRLARFINHPITDVVVMVLIVGSIILLVAEVAASTEAARERLRAINESLIGLFIVELTLRYLAETKKARFWRTYWVDVIATVPFLRALRVLRVLRLLRVFRVGVAISRRMGWLNASLQQGAIKSFAMFFAIVMIVLFGGLGLRIAERRAGGAGVSIGDSLWWSVMSLVAGEPIGFEPTNTLGRVVALVVMIAGLIIFAVLTGVVSALMVHQFSRMPNIMDLDELREHIVICGWNRSGHLLVQEFQSDPETASRPIVVVGEFEGDPTWLETVPRPEMIYVVRGDFTRLEVLNKANLDRASHAIVLSDRLRERSDQDRDARAVLAALLIERLNKRIFTSVELLNRDNETFLKLIGVEEVVVADEYAARVIASATKNMGLVSLIDELLTARYGNQFYKVATPRALIGQSFEASSLWMKARHDATLIGLEEARDEDGRAQMLLNPRADRTVLEGERLLVIARERPVLE